MLLLVEDVSSHRLKIAGAHGERAVALLPREQPCADFGVHPFRGSHLNVLHEIGKAVGGLQPGEQMFMVRRSADRDRDAAGRFYASADKSMKPFAPVVRDRRLIFEGVKNDVVMETKVCLGHRCAARLQRAGQCLGL